MARAGAFQEVEEEFKNDVSGVRARGMSLGGIN